MELFSEQSEHIVALDNSPEMLRVARAKIDRIPAKNGTNIDVMLGDFNALPLDDASFDTLILHQVLHYAQNPKRVIEEASRVLADNGRLMIVDFAPHDLEELRRNHAHARLGFSNDIIEQNMRKAGLHMAHQCELPNKRNQSNDDAALTVSIWLGHKNTIKNSANGESSHANNKVSKLKVVK